MKLADVVMFNDELDLLKVRLAEHFDFVDKFYVVEATRTHSYKPKPLYFAENAYLFDEWQSKIEHIVVDAEVDFVPSDAIFNEHVQRGYLSSHRDISGFDYLIHLDADEIIDRRAFPRLLAAMEKGIDRIAPKLRFFYYYVNTEWGLPWQATRIFRVRNGQVPDVSNPNGGDVTPDFLGWHFSFLGNPSNIRQKIQSFMHVEYDLPEFTTEARIAERMSRLVDPFD